MDDLHSGEKVVVKFDRQTRTALTIIVLEHEERRVDDNDGNKFEAVIVDITGNEITVETEDGRKVGVLVDERTHIEVNGHAGTLEDLKVGENVGVWYDPETHTALAIFAFEDEGRRVDDEGNKFEAVIVEITGNEVTVETEDGRKVGVLVDERTHIEVSGHVGTLEDLKVGARVGVWFDPETHTALAIFAFEDDVRRIEETEGKKIEAVIVEIGEDQIIVETDEERKIGLLVGERTHVEVDGNPGTRDDLWVGAWIGVWFDPMTHRAFGIVTFGDHERGVEEPDVAKIEGVIVEVNDRGVIVETDGGRRVGLVVGERTHIQVGDYQGTLSDMEPKMEVVVEFNPETGVAFGIFVFDTNVEEPDVAKIEGVIVEVNDRGVTVETDGGRRVGLVVNERTHIQVGDHQGTLDDLQPGTEVVVEFNADTFVVFGILVLEKAAVELDAAEAR